ncbi:hypothetical protein JOE57_000541 [Microlunatus panaciterrae]|uniref:DUF222 domain-containing protein n=1 Tax=Microlunatus panaciterrae TaxID=400768 RepID=A0ABS2RF44_9ACTN|nr:hypothetical protein [Microlunatus panaciterrae]MBM7797620.1 hypothetical protein [Microlunatus panaciterrae]
MFDVEQTTGMLTGMDATTLLSVVAEAHRGVVEREALILQAAAQWADLHSAEAADGRHQNRDDSGEVLPGTERARLFGGDGTPTLLEFAAAEFGIVQELSPWQAARMIADALDLRHRLRRLWLRVCAGEVPAWKACKVAQATRHLKLGPADQVDESVYEVITRLTWSRFQDVLVAKIIEADPHEAQARADRAERERFVRTGRANEHGLKSLYAKATVGDVLWLDAMIARLAKILAAKGDTDSVDIRRSKALGLLGNPVRCLALLAEAEGLSLDDDDRDAEESAFAMPRDGHYVPPGRWAPMGSQEDELADLDLFEPANVDQPEPANVDQPEPLLSAALVDPAPDSYDEPVEECTDAGRAPSVAGPRVAQRALESLPAAGIDPDRLGPRLILYAHVALEGLQTGKGVVRVEGVGPVTLEQLRRHLGPTAQVILKPVIDLSAPLSPVDAYELPAKLRESLRLRCPGDVFPWASGTGTGLQIDHTLPYRSPDRGGPPGQTRLGNCGPLGVFSHRLKTHGGMALRQPRPGTYVWRSRHGFIYLVDHTGTHHLGCDAFARAIWRAAVAMGAELGGRQGQAA